MMRHFDSCRCEQCRQKRMPEAAGHCGFLMQQILAAGRQQYRCEPFHLTLGPLPRNLIPPLYVADVSACGEVRVVEESCACAGNARQVQAVIPLSVVVCDQNGQRHVTTSEISVPVSLCLPPRGCHEAGAQYMANALVKMGRRGDCFAPGEEACVYLDVCVQVFLVLYRPMYAPQCESPCPDLPLYPQPCKCHAPWR